MYKPEHIMTFGKNKGLTLKQIYQYKPTYIQYLVEFFDGFEIDINDFRDLPNPTVADPNQLPPDPEHGGLRFYPPIKLEASVE